MIEIKEKKESPLLSRIEVIADLSYENTTPSNVEIKKQLAKKLNVDEKLVMIKNIKTYFGMHKAKIFANVYKKDKDIREPEHIFRKQEPKEKKEKPVEKPKEEKAEAKKEEKPKEAEEKKEPEKKEEKTPEKKPE